MKNIIKLTLASSLVCSALNAQEVVDDRDRIPSVRKAIQSVSDIPQEDPSVVGGLKRMVKYGKISGEVRSIYTHYDNADATNTYATAVGTQLKYELAKFKGFNGGIALSLSRDINAWSGDTLSYTNELSSEDGSYAQMSELYIDYEYENFSLRGGRQVLDTPLADSDDVRMIPNTFEAYIVNYTLNDFSFMGGLIKEWQGADAGLDTQEPWQETGKDGTYFGGVSYESDLFAGSAWYYDVSENDVENVASQSAYADISSHYDINENVAIYGGLQYLNQREQSNSGVKSSIYGANAEVLAYGLGLNLAYNKAEKYSGKNSFSGFGGGTLFTSMDSMIIDAIADDREAEAVVAGLSYSIGDFNLLYAYGDFKGGANSAGQKEHIVEQDIGLEYTPSENITIASIYTMNDDKENTATNDGNWNNFRVLFSYNFQMTLKNKRFKNKK